MIAREGFRPPAAGSGQGGLPRRLLLWWRHALARVADAASRGLRAVVHVPGAAIGAARTFIAEGAVGDVRHPAMTVFGGVAVCIGVAGGVALASPGLERREAALAGLVSVAWALVRWLIVRFASPATLAEDPAALRGAYGLGLLCYAFAVTPELRLAAWAGSATVTGVLLVRMGWNRRESARVVALAWGAQALVALGGWLARYALVAYYTIRG